MGNAFGEDSQILLGKLESTAGTVAYATPVTADFDVRVRNLELANLDPEFDEDDAKYATGDHTHDENIEGKEPMGISFDIKSAQGELTDNGDGTFTGKLPFEKYIKSAGLKSVFDNTVGSWLFTPSKEYDVVTVSESFIDKDADSGKGIEYCLAGGMSELQIVADGVGKPFMFKFATKGKVSRVATIASASMPVIDDSNMIHTPAFTNVNCDITVQECLNDGTPTGTAHAFCSNTFTLDLGSKITEAECQSDNSGILYNYITKRSPKITINPLLETLDDYDFWDALKNMTRFKVVITKYKTGAKIDKVMEITLPITQQSSAKPATDDTKVRNEMTFRALRNLQGATQEEKENDYSIKLWGTL